MAPLQMEWMIWLSSLNSGGERLSVFTLMNRRFPELFVEHEQIAAEMFLSPHSLTCTPASPLYKLIPQVFLSEELLLLLLLSLRFLSVQQPVGVTSAAACRVSVWESHRRTFLFLFLSSALSSSVWWRRQIWVERKTTCSTLRSCWRSTRGGREWRWESWRTARVAAGRRSTRRREPGTETPSSPGSWRGSRCVLSRSCATVAAENRSSSPSRRPTWLRWFRRAAPAEDPGRLSCSWCRLWSACCRGRTVLKPSWSSGRCWFTRAEPAAGRQDQLWTSSASFRLTPTRSSLNDRTGWVWSWNLTQNRCRWRGRLPITTCFTGWYHRRTDSFTFLYFKLKLTCSLCTSECQNRSDVLIKDSCDHTDCILCVDAVQVCSSFHYTDIDKSQII